MTKWLMLAGAIVTEVSATLSLKAALHQPAWYLVVVIGYASALMLIAGAMQRGLPLGVAYGIWAALGVAVTALGSHLIFGEALTPLMLLGLGLIIVGVLCIELGSTLAERKRAGAGRKGAHS